MTIPKTLKIGGHNFKIIYPYRFKERFDRLGWTDLDLCKIHLSGTDNIDKLPISKIEEVFIHEMLHAIDEVYNANKLDEDTVKRLSCGLYQVLKDNNLLK